MLRNRRMLWGTHGNPMGILWEDKGKATEARCYGTGGGCGRPMGTLWESYGRIRGRQRRQGVTEQGDAVGDLWEP